MVAGDAGREVRSAAVHPVVEQIPVGDALPDWSGHDSIIRCVDFCAAHRESDSPSRAEPGLGCGYCGCRTAGGPLEAGPASAAIFAVTGDVGSPRRSLSTFRSFAPCTSTGDTTTTRLLLVVMTLLCRLDNGDVFIIRPEADLVHGIVK